MRIKMHFHYCFTVYILIEVENTKQLTGKNTDGEKWWKFLRNFFIFSHKVFQSGPNGKRSINILPLNSSRTFEAFWGIVFAKSRKKNIKEINFNFFVKKYWN